ncbi:MAG: response regulator [Dehalococcoidia bacterium]|jgi:CheY-like chemotaxis protein
MQATDIPAVPAKEDNELPRVLFIEDNPADADIVKRVLGDSGVAAVETARTAEEGLRIFRKAEWDLVLLDYRLPGSSGLAALDRLRKIDPDVPAIVLTGAGDDQIATDAIRLGADEYLSKDAVLTVLPTAVRTFLEVKRADARRRALLAQTEREEELKGLTEAGKRLLQSVPADSAGLDGGQPASARRQLVAAFAQLYRAVRMCSGGLPGIEVIDLCRVAGNDRLSARQIVELHMQAVDEVIRDEWRPQVDLPSRLNDGLLLAVLWLNDSWTKSK